MKAVDKFKRPELSTSASNCFYDTSAIIRSGVPRGRTSTRGMAMPSTGRRFWTLSGHGMKTTITIAVLMSVTPARANNIYLTESGTCATGYVRDGRFCVAIETEYEGRSCPRSTFRSGNFCKVKPDPAYHLLPQWFSDLGFRSW
jgi:hypothetical protein